MTAHTETLRVEVVEGPDSGRSVDLGGPIVIGRDAEADLRIDDDEASRRHARITPSGGGAFVEDLGSTNGTFVNQDAIEGPTVLVPGDEILVGVTVLEVRDRAQVAAVPSAVRPVPPALAAAPRSPTYLSREPVEVHRDRPGPGGLDRLVDHRIKTQARIAPLALFVLVALAVLVYYGVR